MSATYTHGPLAGLRVYYPWPHRDGSRPFAAGFAAGYADRHGSTFPGHLRGFDADGVNASGEPHVPADLDARGAARYLMGYDLGYSAGAGRCASLGPQNEAVAEAMIDDATHNPFWSHR